jgi:hypothetical protein
LSKSKGLAFLSMGEFIELGLIEDYYFCFLLHLICFVNKVVMIEKNARNKIYVFFPFGGTLI